MWVFGQLLLVTLACSTVLCLPIPYTDTDTLLQLLQLQQQLLSTQQAQLEAMGSNVNAVQEQGDTEQLQQLLERMSRGQLSTQQATNTVKQQLAGQLNNVIQRAAKSLLDRVESKSPPTESKINVPPGGGVKLHIKAPEQQPQVYYTPPVNPVPLPRSRIIVPIRRPPPPITSVPSIPDVHIHPVEQIPPVKPVEPVPETPQVHIYHPQPPKPQPPITPHLHLHPTTANQKVAIKPLPPIPPMKPAKPVRRVSKPPVLHIHPSPNENHNNVERPGYKDRKENDVQLKLNMDFKAHNRTGFQELERLVNQVQIQSDQGIARENGYLTQGQGVETLLSMLQNKAAVQELSDIVTARVLREVKAQFFGL